MKNKFGIFLVGGFLALSTIAAATGNFAVRLDLAAQEANRSRQGDQVQTAQATQVDAQSAQATTETAIGIQRITLSQGAATGFGQFRARSNVIAPGTPFNIYFEPTNLTTRFENGNVRASMSVDILVRNAQGQTVAVRDNAWQLPIARAASGPAQLTQVYGDLTVNHLTFAEGRYQIVLRVHDDFNGTFVDRVLDVELQRPPVTLGPRLSQSGQGTQTR